MPDAELVDRLDARFGWTSVKKFGALGNDVDDTVALQNAIDSGVPLYFPAGIYRITAPLTHAGSVFMKGVNGFSGAPSAIIRGNFQDPLIYTAGYRIDYDPVTRVNSAGLNESVIRNGYDSGGTGKAFQAENMRFVAEHDYGCVMQLYNVGPGTNFRRCQFGGYFRGLLITQGFSCVVENSHIAIDHFNRHTDSASTGRFRDAYGLYLPGHSSAVNCNFQFNGVGIIVSGTQCSIINCRSEMNGIGYKFGTDKSLSLSAGFQTPNAVKASLFSALMTESNLIGAEIYSANECIFEGINITANLGADVPYPVGICDSGLEILGASASCVIRNVAVSGKFRKYPIRNISHATMISVGSSWSADASGTFPQAIEAGYGTGPFSDAEGKYSLDLYPAGPNKITAYSEMQLRGLKGLNILDPAQPNNLGGVLTLAQGAATTQAVSFRGTAVAQFDVSPAANGADGSLPTDTYYYGVTLIGPRGEAGGGQWNNPNPSSTYYRSVAVTLGQGVDLSIYGFGTRPDLKVRWYRGREIGYFDGYYETAVANYRDTGQAFTGRAQPPEFTSIKSQNEPDANYAIVATPSWDTKVWVTNKQTTGFTLNFDGPVPAQGGTIQWLLFRP